MTTGLSDTEGPVVMGSGLAQERAPERRVTRNEGWYYSHTTRCAGVWTWGRTAVDPSAL